MCIHILHFLQRLKLIEKCNCRTDPAPYQDESSAKFEFLTIFLFSLPNGHLEGTNIITCFYFSKNVLLCFQVCIDGQTKLFLAVHCELSNLARPTMGNSNIRSEGIFLLFSHCYSQEKERKKGKDRTELAERKQLHIDIADFFQLTSSNGPSHLFFQSFCHKIKSINLFIGTESTIHATLLPSKSKIFDKKKNQRENLALQLTEMIGCKTSIKADVLVRNQGTIQVYPSKVAIAKPINQT